MLFLFIISLSGAGQICTKTFQHERSNMHVGTLSHENTFARRVTFAGRVILHKSKKKNEKMEKVTKNGK